MPGVRVFVGRLHPAARERDIEKLFRGYGKVREVMLKRGFAFVELDDEKDAEDAVHDLTGKEVLGERISIEFARGTPHGRDRIGWKPTARGGSRDRDRRRSRSPKREREERSDHRVVVENLSSRVSSRDLKEMFAEVGKVVYASNNTKNREGTVEFAKSSGVKAALDKFEGKEIKGRKVKLVNDSKVKKSRSPSVGSRSRSPHSKTRSRTRSGSNNSTKSSKHERGDDVKKEDASPISDKDKHNGLKDDDRD